MGKRKKEKKKLPRGIVLYELGGKREKLADRSRMRHKRERIGGKSRSFYGPTTAGEREGGRNFAVAVRKKSLAGPSLV